MDNAQRRQLFDYMGYHGDHIDGCYDHILRTMFASHAGLLILPVQDLLLYGSDTRFNTPGRAEGNWAYRVTADQLASIDRLRFRRMNRLYGR
jgi:4-alpha-glucanotransferase